MEFGNRFHAVYDEFHEQSELNSGINSTPILNADWLTASTHVIILQNGSEKEGGLDAIPVTDYQVEETTYF